MRVPLSWLREHVQLPAGITGRDVSDALIRFGLEVETVETVGDVSGPLVIGRVDEITELTEFKKPIRFCRVDVGEEHGGVRGIVCGARNFAVGDSVVVALPGAVLPGGFEIVARKTYGQVSDGMICSARELGLGDDHTGILVLPAESGEPGANAHELLGLGEEVLDIAVTPDRGYCLSIRGVAREAAIAFDLPFNDRTMDLAPLSIPESTSEPVSCASDDFTGCDVFTLRTLVGVDGNRPSPLWMQHRLIAAGMRPISLIVDVTNYVMLETGQPLHAFDVAKVRGGLVARRARPGEKLETLDHVERVLDTEDLVIADDSGPLALAGTMGGLATEIGPETTVIALEAAHFDPVVVARMSRRHKLSTEASRRFERGVDRVIAPYASERAASLLQELGGGHNVGLTGHESPHEPVIIRLASDLPARTAGMPIADEQVSTNLEAVGCRVTADADGGLRVTPPTWRPDLTDPADLCEEVIRLIGYDQVPSRLPKAPAGRGLTPEQRLRRRASRVAAGLGLTEVLTYPFVGTADLDRCGIGSDDPRYRFVRIQNPLSDEQPGFRTTLLPGLLATAKRNVSRGADTVAIYELGLVAEGSASGLRYAPRLSVDRRPDDADLERLFAAIPHQQRHLAAVVAGAWQRAGWWGPAGAADWADAVELARRVVNELGIDVEVRAAATAPFHPGRCAELLVADVVIGHAGELHPRVCTDWGLPARTVGFELNLDAVIDEASGRVASAPRIRTMPVAKEDVAVIVDAGVPAQQVAAALAEGAGELLESIRLFDVYTGPQIGEGNKSLAFALRFRAADRTLSVDEVSAARDAAVARAAEVVGATQRA